MLEDNLAAELRGAMRTGDVTRRDTIRQLRAALHNESIAKGHALSDEESIAVVQRLVNQHRDSISEFKRGNRDDLVAKEEAELEVLLGYLPEQLSREAIVAAATAIIQKVGATGNSVGFRPRTGPPSRRPGVETVHNGPSLSTDSARLSTRKPS